MRNTVSDSASEFNQSGSAPVDLYRKDGKVEKMWRTINGADSLEIRFMPDENGNPGEERTFRKDMKPNASIIILMNRTGSQI